LPDTGVLILLCCEQGANIEAKGDDGGTALLHAAAAGKRPVVDYLLKQGADIDVKHVDGGTVLTEFAGEGWSDLVKQMVKRGMDVEVRGKDGWSVPKNPEPYFPTAAP
jgi:ankyrin repeat protein